MRRAGDRPGVGEVGSSLDAASARLAQRLEQLGEDVTGITESNAERAATKTTGLLREKFTEADQHALVATDILSTGLLCRSFALEGADRVVLLQLEPISKLPHSPRSHPGSSAPAVLEILMYFYVHSGFCAPATHELPSLAPF